MDKNSAYRKTKSQIFNRYIDNLFNLSHSTDKILSEYKDYARYFRANYLKYLPHNKKAKILEIGCGLGHFQYFLRMEGYQNLRGIDISEQEIEFCLNQGFNVKKADALSFITACREKFDVIIFDDIIYYFTRDDVVVLLKNIHRVLNDQGKCFIKTLNMSNPITASNSNFRDFATEFNYTEESLKQICLLSGFENTKIFPLNIYIFYLNPLNYMALIMEFILSNIFRILFWLYGRKTTKIFTKDILAVCTK